MTADHVGRMQGSNQEKEQRKKVKKKNLCGPHTKGNLRHNGYLDGQREKASSDLTLV